MEIDTQSTKEPTLKLNQGRLGESGHSAGLDEVDTNLSLQRINYGDKPEFIGRVWTFVSFKNPTSFAIGTHFGGLVVTENNVRIYSERFSSQNKSLNSIIYIEHLNCYLLHHENQIFRKDINNQQPFLFIDVTFSFRPGGCFRYSKVNRKLIIVKDRKNVAVINFERRRVDFEIKSNNDSFIQDLRLFGKGERKVVYMTNLGCISVCCLSYDLRKLCFKSSYQVQLETEKPESSVSLAVYDQGKYILAGTASINPLQSCRMLILRLKDRSIIHTATLYEQAQQGVANGVKFALEFWRRIQGHILWIGLSCLDGFVHVYDFDAKSGELRELVDKKVKHQETNPWILQSLGDKLYYTGYKGHAMAIAHR